jgi:hypothetical protein
MVIAAPDIPILLILNDSDPRHTQFVVRALYQRTRPFPLRWAFTSQPSASPLSAFGVRTHKGEKAKGILILDDIESDLRMPCRQTLLSTSSLASSRASRQISWASAVQSCDWVICGLWARRASWTNYDNTANTFILKNTSVEAQHWHDCQGIDGSQKTILHSRTFGLQMFSRNCPIIHPNGSVLHSK